jgi:hypothetical protein
MNYFFIHTLSNFQAAGSNQPWQADCHLDKFTHLTPTVFLPLCLRSGVTTQNSLSDLYRKRDFYENRTSDTSLRDI